MNGCKSGGGGSSPAPAPTGGAVSLSGSIKLAQGGTITLSGSIKYEDKLYDNNGFTGTTIFKPIRFATVEVILDSAVLFATTDQNGGYSLVFTNTGSPGIYIRVISETSNLHVKNNITDNAIYAVRSVTIDSSVEGGFTTVSSGAGGAFNILDVLTDGMTFLISGLGVTNPPVLTAYWETNSCDGTFFEGFDNSIHLLGGCPSDNPADTDEYDDDIILHEFGHFAAFNFSKDDSPGGTHFLNDNTEDIRLAWSEGWAHFFSSAIRGNPTQVDTVGSFASFFEIEGPSLPFSSIYTTSEVSVATVLWDIFDNTNEAFDALSLGIDPIWDVFSKYLPTALSVSMEDFWDGWFARGHNSQTEMINISSDRKMELSEDSFDIPSGKDNTPDPTRKIALGSIEHHTLYPAGDKDVVAFDVISGQTYTIQTINLTNGADTYIEILDSSENPIAGKNNDNQNGNTYPIDCPTITQSCPPNNKTTLSSSVPITPSSSGTLFVRVSRSPSAPDSAGTYGSYDLVISTP